MSIRSKAAVGAAVRTMAAGLGLLAAACNPTTPAAPAKTEETKPVAAPAPADDRFLSAVNFECDGGAKLDVVFGSGGTNSALVRLDGGAAMELPADAASQSGMVFKDASTTLNYEGESLKLTTGGKTSTCKFVSRELPPPKVGGVVRDLKIADAGAEVTMKVGEKISVSLSGVPTAGYVWSAEAPPAFVKVTDGPSAATTSAQALPGFAGGNHWEVLVIEAVAKGAAEIDLVQKRPWETKPDPDNEHFKFKLKVE